MFIVSAVFLLHHFDVLGWFFVPHFLLSGFLPPTLLTELQCAFTFMFAADCFLFLLFSQPPGALLSSVQTRRHAAKPGCLVAGCIVSASIATPPVLRFFGFGFGLASHSAKPQVVKAFFFFRARLGEVLLSEWAQTFADPCACFFFDLSLCFAT